jgi:hypothetical protein
MRGGEPGRLEKREKGKVGVSPCQGWFLGIERQGSIWPFCYRECPMPRNVGDEAEKEVYIVGKTKSGQWAGLKTTVVET